jgi:hypothetical protein
MRSTFRLLVLAAALMCAGCATTAGNTNQTVLGQRLLDKYLSPAFTGDLDINENIPLYLNVTLKGSNLRRESDGWKYD